MTENIQTYTFTNPVVIAKNGDSPVVVEKKVGKYNDFDIATIFMEDKNEFGPAQFLGSIVAHCPYIEFLEKPITLEEAGIKKEPVNLSAFPGVVERMQNRPADEVMDDL